MEQVRQWITAEGRTVTCVLPEAERTKIINRSLELLRDVYTDKPEALATSLRNAFPYTLYRLFWTKQQRRTGPQDEPFAGWPQFADTLIAGLAANPIDIARQIAALVVRQVGTPDELAFDHERCDALFGDSDKLIADIKAALADRDAGPLVAALLEKRESPHSDEEGNAVLDAGDHIDDEEESEDGDIDADDGA